MRGSQYGFGNGTGMVPVRTSQWRCPEPQTIFGKTLLGQASKTSLAAMSRACVCKPSVIKCRRTIGAANGKKGRRTDQVTQKKAKPGLRCGMFLNLENFVLPLQNSCGTSVHPPLLIQTGKKGKLPSVLSQRNRSCRKGWNLEPASRTTSGRWTETTADVTAIFIGWMREIALSCHI